jgi:UDP-N-acetylglucosamine transferase subunit ALG13
LNLGEKINTVKEKPLLLFSPLDWGLGHTFRSIPLITQYILQGYKIIVACNSTQKVILQPEFPEVGFVDVRGYGISYGGSGTVTKLKILLQIPKILTRIKAENRWLTSFLKESGVDLVVSDNRYGMYSTLVPSVIITHQLRVRTGFGGVADRIFQRLLYRWINRFSECWVPDVKENGIAGELSHPAIMPNIPVKYIGLLSRFEMPCNHETYEFKFCIILSGPEPQRTIFERIIIGQLKGLKKKTVLVRGLPLENELLPPIEDVTIFNYAGTAQLQKLICKSEYVICRAGYTSIMDLVKLNKKMILVPTPGQTEQEYLASYLSLKGMARSYTQNEFSMSAILSSSIS